MHFCIKKGGSWVDATAYVDPDNPRPVAKTTAEDSNIPGTNYYFEGRNQSYYDLTDEQVILFEAVIIGEGGTNTESVFWTASAMFNRIDAKTYKDTKAMKILTKGWSEVYNKKTYKKYLNNIPENVDQTVRAVINGSRAHKYTDFSCDAPGNQMASEWIEDHKDEKYEWFKGNMYYDWLDYLK